MPMSGLWPNCARWSSGQAVVGARARVVRDAVDCVGSSSSRTRLPAGFSAFCVWQATQLRSRIGLMSR